MPDASLPNSSLPSASLPDASLPDASLPNASLQAEFRHPLLVQIYDAESTWGRDDDLFLTLVDEAPAETPGGARVLDLGCGTGRLTLALAAAGHTVTGVDPARASLAAARAKPGAERVSWVEGTSSDLSDNPPGPDASYDVAVMTAHVAQFFVEDDEWARTLADLRRALVPGGRLVFESRDPADRRWERWNPVDSRHHVTLPDGRTVEVWTEGTEVTEFRNGGCTVTFTHHYAFPPPAEQRESQHVDRATVPREELLSTATLRFRTETEIRDSLRTAGFTVDRIHGGWRREPVGAGDGEFIVIATAAPETPAHHPTHPASPLSPIP
ncbi:class I SAM-dependent methyltransferase [Streptomyces sp. NPDC021093]|uniref:class I SAM-dependent methyltransferase n=1 Tax=Streptomyces sp. NPDC021093 TaxID=3365112 RepID=UPI0037AB0CCF